MRRRFTRSDSGVLWRKICSERYRGGYRRPNQVLHLRRNAPGVNFYANSTKITAISSVTGAESTTGTAYGGAANGGLYSAIAPGSYTFARKDCGND